MKNHIMFGMLFVFSSLCVFGQQPLPTPVVPNGLRREQVEAEKRRQEQERNTQTQFDLMRQLSEMSDNQPVSERRAANSGYPGSFEIDLKKEQKEKLKPSPSDLNASVEFLKQPNTGIIKLFPDVGCQDNPGVLRADDKCLGWIPNSASYSFRKKKYNWDLLSDLRYKDGFFISDSVFTQGILTSLGNSSLEDISLNKDEMNFLIGYKPETSSEMAADQFKKMTDGIKAGKYIYRNSWEALENTTYALRVIAYHGKFFRKFQGQMFDILEGDKRADILIVFRVIRKDEDGGLTLLWKEMNRQDSPKINFSNKKAKDKSSNSKGA